MADFPAVFDLSALDGTNGFRILGPAAGTSSMIASAGDLNGDGYEDFVIGNRGQAFFVGSPDMPEKGAAWVVFGSPTGFPASLGLSTLNGTNGFLLTGVRFSERFGEQARSAGDVNGDGIDDLIVSAPWADIQEETNSPGRGAIYIVYGTTSGFAPIMSSGEIDGTNGFRINGVRMSAWTGTSASSAGDINGDGFDDVIFAEYWTSVGAYVVFGQAMASATPFSVSSLNGSNGFKVTNGANGFGYRVAAAGDINNDGFDDVLVMGTTTYVLFGKATGFTATLNVASIDGTNGFRIDGAATIASAGDVNGDGYDDIILGNSGANANGANSGAAWVVFGKASGFAADLSLAGLDGTNGFRINGQAGERAGPVASAGDVDGDGYDDLIIGAPTDGARGASAGASYVVFGKASGFSAVLELSSLDGFNGFKIQGENQDDRFGASVAGADVNHDGFSDLLVTTIEPHLSYVIYGHARSGVINYVGTAGADVASGGALNDSLSGMAGQDILYGLGGDDLLSGGDNSDTLYGGDGEDGLSGENGGDILYGGADHDVLYGGEGADKLFGEAEDDYLDGGDGNDRMDGGTGVDRLDGGTGNDLLDGGAGADVLIGGAGNDIFLVDDLLDTTVEADGGGYDIVRTALNGWALAANIEGLELQGSADIDGTGNGGANNLQGNSGANRLDGGAGVDTINGNDGDDIIIGGLGNDLLRGGLGADTFVVAHAFGPVLETDQVYDFSAAEGDIIDLSGAYSGTLALVSSFGKHAGEMTLSFAGGITTLRLDVNGDGKADYQMKINGDVTGESGDWLL